MKRIMGILVLSGLLGGTPAQAAVTISGYVDFGYIAAEPSQLAVGTTSYRQQASGATGANWDADDGFYLNDINIDLTSQLADRISMYASFNFANGGNALIDFAQVDFTEVGFLSKVSVGRLGSVFGIEQRVSESNLNRFINMSLISPITVGSQDGIAVFGDLKSLSYAVSLTNADNLGPNSIGNAARPPAIGGAVGNVVENNNEKAVTGRISAKPLEGLEIGVSASLDIYRNNGIVMFNRNPRRTVLGVDASYVHGPFTLKGEYVTLEEEQTASAAGEIDAHGYYVEGMYDLSARTALGVRYNSVRIAQPGAVAALGANSVISEYSTIAIAGIHKIADNLLLKVEYDINEEKMLGGYVVPSPQSPIEPSNNVLALSLVAGF